MMISTQLELRVTTLEHQQRILYGMMMDQQANVTQMVSYQSDVNSSHDKWYQDMQKQLEMGLMIQNQTSVFMRDIKHWMDELQRQATEAAQREAAAVAAAAAAAAAAPADDDWQLDGTWLPGTSSLPVPPPRSPTSPRESPRTAGSSQPGEAATPPDCE